MAEPPFLFQRLVAFLLQGARMREKTLLPARQEDGVEFQPLGGVQRHHAHHAGRGHTKGDTIVWLPEERTLFSGDLVEYGATPYCGDAHYKDWPQTLQKLRDLKALALVPGRGDALMGEQAVEEGIAGTQQFLSELYKAVSASVEAGDSLKRAYDKAMATLQPRYGNWVIFEHCMKAPDAWSKAST